MSGVAPVRYLGNSGQQHFLFDLKPNSSFKIFDKVYINKAGMIDVSIVHGEMAIQLLVSLGINFEIANNFVTQ